MGKAVRLTFCFLTLLSFVGCGEQRSAIYEVKAPEATATPQQELLDRFVADERYAIEIAVNAWIPVYGKAHIEKEKPYRATLENGIWTVEGSLPKGMDGGVAIAQISRKSGKVLRIIHSK